MAMKWCPAFPKGLVLLEPHHQIVLCHIQDTRCGGGACLPTEKQSVYSAAPVDWVTFMAYLWKCGRLSKWALLVFMRTKRRPAMDFIQIAFCSRHMSLFLYCQCGSGRQFPIADFRFRQTRKCHRKR